MVFGAVLFSIIVAFILFVIILVIVLQILDKIGLKKRKKNNELRKIVSDSSLVISKLKELNLEFDELLKGIEFSHYVYVGLEINPMFSYNIAFSKAKSEVEKVYLIKCKYNDIVSKYLELYQQTLENIATQIDVIKSTGLEQEIYLNIEKEISKSLCKYNLDKDKIYADVYFYNYNIEYKIYEWEFDFSYSSTPIEIRYVPRDLEMERNLTIQKNIVIFSKELLLFLEKLNAIITNKRCLEQIENSTKEIGGVHYYIINDLAYVGGYDSNFKSITISDYITLSNKDVPVVGILDGAFKDLNSLKSIILPETIELIGESAFSGCFQLKEINIPDSVIFIDDNAFTSCLALTKVSLNKNTFLGQDVFAMCNMCSIEER